VPEDPEVLAFDERDFEPLNRFRFLWRWTQPSHAQFPSHVLERIRPLTASKAAVVNDFLMEKFSIPRPPWAPRVRQRSPRRDPLHGN